MILCARRKAGQAEETHWQPRAAFQRQIGQGLPDYRRKLKAVAAETAGDSHGIMPRMEVEYEVPVRAVFVEADVQLRQLRAWQVAGDEPPDRLAVGSHRRTVHRGRIDGRPRLVQGDLGSMAIKRRDTVKRAGGQVGN